MPTEVERYIRIASLRARPGGTPEWRTLPNCFRLRVWHMSTAEALANELADNIDPRRLILHINYVDGIVRGCRVTYLGENFTVLGVSDSAKLRGLELRCAPVSD